VVSLGGEGKRRERIARLGGTLDIERQCPALMVHEGQTSGVGIDSIDLVAGTTGHHAHEGDVLVSVVEQSTGDGRQADSGERED